MSPRTRFNAIVILGILFWGLLIHNLYSFRLDMLMQDQPTSYLLTLLPSGPVIGLIGAVLMLALFLTSVIVINRILTPGKRRRRQTGAGFFVMLVGIAVIAVGVMIAMKYPHGALPQERSGYMAQIVAALLIVFTLFRSRKKILILSAFVLVVALIAPLVPGMSPKHRDKTRRLTQHLQASLDELRLRRSKWATVDAKKIIQRARQRGNDNAVFRFDENLDRITAVDAQAVAGGVLLDIPARDSFRAMGASLRSEMANNAQVFSEYRGGTRLKTTDALGLNVNDIGAVDITMSVSAGSHFKVYWSSDEAIDENNGIRVPLNPGGKTTSYRIRGRVIRPRSDDTVNHIWLIPSDADAKVKIEVFRVYDRTSAVLSGAAFSRGYGTIDDETRRVLFVATPSRLTYRLKVPEEQPRFYVGMAVEDTSQATRFQIVVRGTRHRRTVFSTEVRGESNWRQHYIRLNDWAGDSVNVTLRALTQEPGLAMWSNPVITGARSARPNIVVFLVDGLRADHLGAYGYNRDTSPVFDSLATRGTLFERAYANGTNAKHSLPGLLSSNPMTATGVRNVADVLPASFPTLPEMLREAGYVTAAFPMNSNLGFFSGTHKGFSQLFNLARLAREAGVTVESLDADGLIDNLMSAWIESNRDRSFFMYAHTMDAHGVYDPPVRYRHYYNGTDAGEPVAWDGTLDPDWVTEPTREGRIALYDGEIKYGDDHLRSLLQMLRDNSVMDNTIFVITADHGEYFGEHGGKYGHTPPPFVQGTHVPLLIVGPGFPAGARVAEPVQLMDIMPTLLAATGFSPDPLLMQGASLIPLANRNERDAFRSRAIFMEGSHRGELAIMVDNFHIITNKHLLFDLDADPEESIYANSFILDFGVKNLGRKVVREYVDAYGELQGTVASGERGTLEVDPVALEQLRTLGYIE